MEAQVQIHNLQDMSQEELAQLFGEAAKRKGYKDVSTYGNIVVGVREDPMLDVKVVCMFYCTTKLLSGIQEEEIKEFGHQILKAKDEAEVEINSLYLVSNKHLSNSVEKGLQK